MKKVVWLTVVLTAGLILAGCSAKGKEAATTAAVESTVETETGSEKQTTEAETETETVAETETVKEGETAAPETTAPQKSSAETQAVSEAKKDGPSVRPVTTKPVSELPPNMQPKDDAKPLPGVIVYVPENGKLVQQLTSVNEITEQTIVDKLIEFGVIQNGCEFVELKIEKDPTGESQLVGPGASSPDEVMDSVGTLKLKNFAPGEGKKEDEVKAAVEQTFADSFGLLSVKLEIV